MQDLPHWTWTGNFPTQASFTNPHVHSDWLILIFPPLLQIWFCSLIMFLISHLPPVPPLLKKKDAWQFFLSVDLFWGIVLIWCDLRTSNNKRLNHTRSWAQKAKLWGCLKPSRHKLLVSNDLCPKHAFFRCLVWPPQIKTELDGFRYDLKYGYSR